MDNELREVLESIKGEIRQLGDKVEKIDKRLEVVEFKVDRNTEKVDDLSLDLKVVERNIRRDIRKLSDENETIIEALRQHEILPR